MINLLQVHKPTLTNLFFGTITRCDIYADDQQKFIKLFFKNGGYHLKNQLVRAKIWQK